LFSSGWGIFWSLKNDSAISGDECCPVWTSHGSNWGRAFKAVRIGAIFMKFGRAPTTQEMLMGAI
jgi:hypothetical protein